MRIFFQNEVFHQMAKFMSVGFLNLALSLVIFNLASVRLEQIISNPDVALGTANALAFAVTTTVAFALNSRITFRDHHADFAAYCRYGIVSVFGLVFNTGLTLLFAHVLAMVRHESVKQMALDFPLGKNIAYLGAVGCVFFWNFFMSRRWVFPQKAIDNGELRMDNG